MPETGNGMDTSKGTSDKYDIARALSQVTYNMSGVSLKLGVQSDDGK